MTIDQLNKPLARRERLVVKQVSCEVLVYDLDRNKAHCLNQTAALVWKYCDGENDLASIAKLMAAELRTPVDEALVWHAVSQLGKDHLLVQPIQPPPFMSGMNRREVIRALGVAAAVAIPVVTSIVAPTPAQAATCLPSGSGCTSSAQCCSGLCTGGGTCA